MNTTIDPLLVAKTLFSLAKQQCLETERSACTAGIILLERALQTVLFACLVEKDIQVEDNISFYDLVIAVEQVISPKRLINKACVLGLNATCKITKAHGITVDQHTAMEFFTEINEETEHLIFTIFGKAFLKTNN